MCLTIDAQQREVWLDREDNRREWERLQDALALADDFVFLPAQCGDRRAEDLLGSLLEQWAESVGVKLVGLSLSTQTRVTDVLAALRDAPRPCLFWFRTNGEDLDELFSLLNQKREVISQRAAAPLIMSLHRIEWARFRRRAADFWSIHQAVFRFSPGAESKRFSVDVGVATSIDFAADRRRGGLQRALSGWRLRREELAIHPETRFVGRRTELESLVSMLSTPGARVGVFGPHGIGKTALLRQACARVVDSYPDGIWWIPFLAPELILVGLLDDLGFASRPGEDLEALQRRFRAATAARKALFVVDDVHDAALVDALRPGSWSSLLVSSAQDIHSPSLTGVLTLSGLGSEAGADILREHTRLDEATARRLATALGGNPRIMTSIAMLLSRRPEAAEPLLAFAFADEPLDQELRREVLRGVPEALQSRWSALAVFEGEFDVADAAALSVDRETLEALTRLGFVEPVSAQLYRIPPLLHKLARQRLQASTDSFATWLAYVRRVLVDRKPLAETSDVRAAVDWIRGQRDRDGDVPDPLWDILADAIRAWTDLASAQLVLDLGQEVARARHDSFHEGLVVLWRSGHAARRGDLDHAARTGRDAIEMLRAVAGEVRDPRFVATAFAYAYLGLAQVELERGDLDAAECAIHGGLERADAIVDHQDASRTRADLHTVFARIARARNDFGAEERWLETALDEARQAGDAGRLAIAEISLSLGVLAREVRHDDEAAQRWFDEALAGWEVLGERVNVMRALVELATLARGRGDVELAVHYARRGRSLAEEHGDEALIRTFAELIERFSDADA